LFEHTQNVKAKKMIIIYVMWILTNHQAVHCKKKHFLFYCLPPELQLLTRNSPLWQPATGNTTHMEYRNSWSCF